MNQVCKECRTDAQCLDPDFPVCDANICWECVTDDHCPGSTELCISNVCIDHCTNASLVGDESDTNCGGSCPTKCGFGQGCFDHPDCASGICVDARCSECQTDDDCDTGEVCSNADGSTLGHLCLPSTCQTDGDCPAVYTFCLVVTGDPTGLCLPCNIGTFECPAARPYCVEQGCAECRTDADCPSALPRCNQGVCAVCQSNADCPADLPVCTSGSCEECGTDADCPANAPLCELNVCVVCSSDAECASHFPDRPVCRTGACHPRGAYGTPCDGDGDCLSGFCNLSTCGCTADAHCPDGRACDAGICEAAAPIGCETVAVSSLSPYSTCVQTGAAGSQVTITASGTVDWVHGQVGPDGGACSPFYCDPCLAAPGLTCYALVGKIDGGAPFLIGSSHSFTSTGGRLCMGMNDDQFQDNSGSWTARVCIE